jgi:hypothetical protein
MNGETVRSSAFRRLHVEQFRLKAVLQTPDFFYLIG